ncbi:MAG: TlpA family protein disulfide reductase [Croceitalea sp.]|nr:TlpA family protein disulfide reductase [Croceitalea sp.]
MKFLIQLVFILLFITSCNNSKKNDQDEVANAADSNQTQKTNTTVNFPIYDYEGIEPLLNKADGKTYIVNFWATWCKPCIEELPFLEKVYAEQKSNGVELVLVSLDMPTMWEKRLVPFVKKNDLKGKVVILDDPNMNEWIPKIDEDWGGGIPATLIYNSNKRTFFERGFTYNELNEELNKFLN